MFVACVAAAVAYAHFAPRQYTAIASVVVDPKLDPIAGAVNPDQAADFLAAEPMLKAYGKPLLLQQVQSYNNLYKPTASYPFAKMWGEENARIAIDELTICAERFEAV